MLHKILIFVSIAYWVTQTLATYQMVLVYGKPVIYTTYDTISTGWDDCLAICYARTDCLMSYFEEDCLIFKPNGTLIVQQLTSDSGLVVAFKLALTTCPSNYDPPMFNETTIMVPVVSGNTFNLYQLQKTDDSQGTVHWNYTSVHYVECNATHHLLVRNLTAVCVWTRLFDDPYCRNTTEGVALCESDGGMGLTGSYSAEENDYFWASMNATMLSTTLGMNYQYIQFWVDGYIIFTTPRNFTWTDKSLPNLDAYVWEADSIAGRVGPCAYMGLFVPQARARNCYSTYESNYCFRGAICRMKPILEF